MIKVFTTNKDGKIELTKEELKSLLDEAYWDGYKANCVTYTYHSPSTWSPYTWTTSATTDTCTLNTSTNTSNTVSVPNSACEAH